MLAKNFMYDVDRILPSFGGRPFCMDIKIDGERMLCHREGDKVIRRVLLEERSVLGARASSRWLCSCSRRHMQVAHIPSGFGSLSCDKALFLSDMSCAVPVLPPPRDCGNALFLPCSQRQHVRIVCVSLPHITLTCPCHFAAVEFVGGDCVHRPTLSLQPLPHAKPCLVGTSPYI